jgi:glycosyltransferase involved in cell wall biosynthesis
MREAGPPILLQVCPNDHPPFADICRYYEAVAQALSWMPLTVMLATRTAVPVAGFHYLPAADADSWGRSPSAGLAACTGHLLAGRRPVLTLCHRYRAYRAVVASGVQTGRLVVVAHEFAMLGRRRRLQRHWDTLLGRPRPIFAGVSQPVADELAGAVGAAAVLPNGIDLARADAARLERDEARRALGLADASFTIGVVGRLHPKKNPALAIDGLRSALARMPDACMVFIGDGELEQELQRQAAGLPIVFKGAVPDAVRLMKAFDLLLMPSGDREAFGMVALEAMAASVPVLCGPAPGPRYVVGAAGRRFAPATAEAVGEALAKAYETRQGELGELAAKARARVEQTFSVGAAARRLQALSEGALPGGSTVAQRED